MHRLKNLTAAALVAVFTAAPVATAWAAPPSQPTAWSTASNASVKSTRFRKSGMRNMFLRASTNRFIRLPYGSQLLTTPL